MHRYGNKSSRFQTTYQRKSNLFVQKQRGIKSLRTQNPQFRWDHHVKPLGLLSHFLRRVVRLPKLNPTTEPEDVFAASFGALWNDYFAKISSSA